MTCHSFQERPFCQGKTCLRQDRAPQEAYKIYLTPDEDGPDFGIYGDLEIWIDTEFYFPLEIKSYLKEETCEIFSDFFNEQGMEIQNCFTIVKFIDKTVTKIFIFEHLN